jgi:hypothetical protein
MKRRQNIAKITGKRERASDSDSDSVNDIDNGGQENLK